MKTLWISGLAIAFVTLGSSTAFVQLGTAQEVITHIEGVVFLDGRRLEPSASQVPLQKNSVVRTEEGRVEIRLAAGSTVFLGENGSARWSDNRGLDSSRFEILAGSVVVITGDLGPAVVCEEEVQLSDSGVFRFDVHPVGEQRFCRIRVYEGAAAAQMPSFTWVLKAGRTVELNRGCGDRTQRNNFNVEDIDDLDRWSRQRAVPEARHQ
jgi:hypothetical protein